MPFPVGFVFWQLVVCVYCLFDVAELNEVLDQLRHFSGTFRRNSGIVPYHSLFFPGWKQ